MCGQIRKIVFKLTIIFLQKITQRMTLGIDVGGTNLVVGLVQDGKIVKRVSAPWFPHEATLQETIDTLSERISGIITPDTEKIGIGVPSVVDVKRGIVYDTVNIPSWTEVPLKELLEQQP